MLKTSLAAQAITDLELMALEEVNRRAGMQAKVQVLEVPCGNGRFSVLLAQAGATVTASDADTVREEVAGRALAAGVADQVMVYPQALAQLAEIPGNGFDLVYCRYGLHCFRYAEARELVRQMLARLKIGGKIYLSAYGLYSHFGDAYPAADALLHARFAPLEPAVAARYGVTGPVCLYTERNLVNLLFEAGAGVLRTFTTTHGTVKAVGVRL
jgi:SAM-dependent methyltransferase